MNREAELDLLTHTDKWSNKAQLPVKRRGGKEVGVISCANILLVRPGTSPFVGAPTRLRILR
jgi:hypothetical protein